MNVSNRRVSPAVGRYLDGKAVLATPLSAVRRLLEGERNGVVFRDLGPDFMAAMTELLGDAQATARLGSAARAFVEANYDWRRTIDELEAVLARVTAESRERVGPPC